MKYLGNVYLTFMSLKVRTEIWASHSYRNRKGQRTVDTMEKRMKTEHKQKKDYGGQRHHSEQHFAR